MFGYFLNRSAPVVVSFYVSVCKSLLCKTHRDFLLSSAWFPLRISVFLPQPSPHDTVQCYNIHQTFTISHYYTYVNKKNVFLYFLARFSTKQTKHILPLHKPFPLHFSRSFNASSDHWICQESINYSRL